MRDKRIKIHGESVNVENTTKNDDIQPDDTHHMRLGVKHGDVLKTRTVEDVDGTKYTLELCNAAFWRVVGRDDLGRFITVDDFKSWLEIERIKSKK